MSAQIVVDISSDEEDDAAKSSTKTRSTGKQPTDSTRTAVKSPSRISPIADKPKVSTPVTANHPKDPTNIDPRSRSADTSPPQTDQEALQNRAPSAPQTAASTSSHPPTPTPTTEQDPPKPTPLNINEFRHLVSAGSVPVKDSPLILSIQPATPATNKRKATDTLESNLSSRPRPVPLPPTPYTGTSEHPVPPKSSSVLWSVPAYKPPEPTQSQKMISTNPTAMKQPSIPNIHAPLTSVPLTTTTITTSPPIPTPLPTPTPKPRQRESKWTGAQLANLASALESAFFPSVAAFADENQKTVKQVKDTYSFLFNKRIFEYSDEAGGGDGGRGGEGKGKGRGKGKVARRFEREMRADRKNNEKVRKEVHRKEKSEGHWASEGMGKPEQKRRGRKKEGVLEAAVEGEK